MSVLDKATACRLSNTASTSLEIPKEFTSIGRRAFESCRTTPAKITIPEGVTTIGNFGFYGTNPKHWSLPNSIESIGRYAFHDSNIKSISFGPNIKRIGSDAFTGNNFKRVTLPSDTKVADDAFDDDVIIKRTEKSSKIERDAKATTTHRVKNIDEITNFNPLNDIIEINIDDFGISRSATFAAGKNKKKVMKLAKKDFDFLYDQQRGGLYFNENGSDQDFGDGGIIAILKGAPDIKSSNLEFT